MIYVNGVKMTIKYKCGCESEGYILFQKKALTSRLYDNWAHSVGVFGTLDLCLYCWLEKEKIKLHISCRYVNGKWCKNEK